ncbi:peroxidase isoform X1 [Bradysia coprophila]|uniref:peroxidase isoform X1 n=1 Tax=Bradysia coprophila TaxID=38358 RepID=UPI00187DBC43|nr:peroxidase isoform X1 [Bradysia coprophila]
MNTNRISLVFLMIVVNFCDGIFEFNGDIRRHDNELNIEILHHKLVNAITFAKESMVRLKRLEDSISNSRINVTDKSISFAQLLEGLPNERSKEYDRIGQIILEASIKILNAHCTKNGYKAHDCARMIAKIPLPESDVLGQCNNIAEDDNITMTSNVYRRLLPAAYKDGLYKMPLHRPQPKNISDALFNSITLSSDIDKTKYSVDGILDPIHNIAVVQWAQFIEHDLVKTVVRTMSNDCPIECCERDMSSAPPRYTHPSCSPLKVAGNFGKYITCLSYVRSAIGVHPNCHFGAANQINQATNNFDLSQLYGINDEVTRTLRRFVNGELLASNDPDYPCLPTSDDSEKLCMHNSDGKACFKSGDTRVNVNPYVTPLYTIFLRSHNRLAKKIRAAKRSWNDQRVFTLARKLNTVIYRNIVLNEWSKIVLGEKNVEQMIDEISSTSHIADHTDPLSNGISNEFATAGIRFYYSMMPGECTLKRNIDHDSMSDENNIIAKIRFENEIMEIKNEYYKPRSLGTNNELDVIMDAILTQNSMAMDSAYVDDVTRYMYRFQYSQHSEVGTDVLALDLLRGRDHGLADYKSYLQGCTNVAINTWDDLKPYITEMNFNRLKSLYTSVDTIDLIVGAISEKPLRDAIVGPTFACIIGEQLKTTLRSEPEITISNRFAKDFTANYDAARLMCETTKLVTVPKNIFKLPSKTNTLVDCSIYRNIMH